jgi:two-component system, OmpR family, KDP operon response regulator KdpE
VTTVLVVDDDPAIQRTLAIGLRARGYQVLPARDGRTAVEAVRDDDPDVVLLDLGLPDLSGVDVLRRIRRHSQVPVIVLSARHGSDDKVEALDVGADDYVTKPFGVIEFRARVRAQLRRARITRQQASEAPLRLGALTVDVARRTLVRDGTPVHLTPTEWELLLALLRRPGRTVTHRQLFREVWNDSYGDMQQYLRVYVAHLRKKIESDPYAPRHLITEPGVGYRLEIGD